MNSVIGHIEDVGFISSHNVGEYFLHFCPFPKNLFLHIEAKKEKIQIDQSNSVTVHILQREVVGSVRMSA